MRFNNNEQPYLNSLRENLVYPPFSEIEELVLAHEERNRGLAIFARPTMEAAVLALIAVALLWWNTPSPTIPGTKQSIAGMARLENADHDFHWHHQSKPDLSFPRKRESRFPLQREDLDCRIRGNDSKPDLELNRELPKEISRDNTMKNATPENSPENKSTQPNLANGGFENAIINSNTDIASIEPRDVHSLHWVAYILGGSVAQQQLSLNSLFTQPFSGSAGIRYKISGASSLILELRDNTFVIGKISTGTIFNDTTLYFSGEPYHNHLGTVQYVNWGASIASLDLGYRFEFAPEFVISPFAEALIGGSIYGALSSEVVGVRSEIVFPFLLDVCARGDQLFSPGSAPLKSFGFEAGVGFGW